jgi:hypothetical protein
MMDETWPWAPPLDCLGILMRLLIGAGTPREAAARGLAYLFFVVLIQTWSDRRCWLFEPF